MKWDHAVFWEFTPCSLIGVYRRFWGNHCFLLQNYLVIHSACWAYWSTPKMGAACSVETLLNVFHNYMVSHTTKQGVFEIKHPQSILFLQTERPMVGVGTFITEILYNIGAPDSVVGWGTILQAERSRVRVTMRWIFFNLPYICSRTTALGSTQSLTEMSTRNLPGG
jgi:hypothetical protein